MNVEWPAHFLHKKCQVQTPYRHFDPDIIIYATGEERNGKD